MRIRVLRLIAFGPFSGHELRLFGPGIPADALHVVFGRNEAGKSTTLRAISGLLFGIPSQTRDAHRHAMADLRIGAELAAADGTTLEIVRRKGNKNTLLDPAGKVLDEATLQRLCGTTTEAMFRALFGLDHNTLREGGQALLSGGGDVGESLFDAALGGVGRGIHLVLQQIDRESKELFAPQAQKPQLNEAIRAFQDARRQIRDRSSDAWVVQQRGLDEARADQERVAAQLRERRRELARLQRSKQLLPLVAHWQHLCEQLAALGDVIALPADAAPKRLTATHGRDQAQAELTRIAADLAAARARHAGLQVPDWLDQPVAQPLVGLPDRLGAFRKAAEDRPRLAGALAALEDEASSMADELPAAMAGRAPPRLSVDAQERLRELALHEAVVGERHQAAQRAVASLARRHEACVRALAELPPARDPRPLRTVLRRIERAGDLTQQWVQARDGEAQLVRQVGEAMAHLAPAVDPATLLHVAVPEAATVDDHARQWRALAERDQQIADERDAAERRRQERARELAQVHAAERLPSPTELAGARATRDELWQRLRQAFGARDAAAQAELGEQFAAALARADQLADRLWREADRVARAAALEREVAEQDRRLAQLAERRAEILARQQSARVAWQELWRRSGVEPGTPDVMRAWLPQFIRVRDLASRRDAARAAAGALAEQVRAACADLRTAMGGGEADADLRALCDAAEARTQALEDQAAERAALVRDLATLDGELAAARDAHRAAEEAVTRWRADWEAAVAPLGLPASASAIQATAVLGALTALARKHDEIAQMRRRVDSIDRDAETFHLHVEALAAALAPDLRGRAAADIAAELVARHETAKETRSLQQASAEAIERMAGAQRDAQARRADAERQLVAMLAAARLTRGAPGAAVSVADLDALEQAEARSQQAADLRARRDEAEARILGAADGLTLAAAVAETRGAEAEDLVARIDGAREEIEALEVEQQRAQYTLGEREAGLRVLEARGGEAADLAAQAQEHLARVRSLAADWTRLRLAGALLARTVEHYRDQHQGPLLQRAGALFARLTGDRYGGLRADFDAADQPVLRCLRADGQKVAVDALSDGTRDQLYLALRLASLERQAQTGEPLPLVLDDVLVHFDDQRAAAALSALADHARVTQVLLFTHHARVVELARSAVPAQRLHVIEWEPPD